MKRLLSILLVVMMVMSMALTAVYAEETTEDVTLPFTDVKDGKWYTDAVKYVYANGLMNGKSETKFAPNEVLTRAQFAKMLWSLAGEPATEANLDFADTKNTQWYAESLTWAVSAGIVNGYEEGGKKLFKPNKEIFRDELAKMIVTFLEYMEVEIVGEDVVESFPDANKFQKWAVPFIDAVRASGLMQGKDGGVFAPKATATRAEGATILMRMHPSLAITPTKIMEEMVENFLGEYQCATHTDIFIVNNFGGSHTNEAIAAAVATFMQLDPAVYTLAVTEGEVPNEGCGRQGYDYGDLVFTLTDIASGETVEFATGVICYKYYNIGANDEDGTVRCYNADPIYVLPVGCPEDISSITTPQIAAAALENLPTEYAVTEFTYEAIWNAIDAAISFDDKISFETVLYTAELDAIIAAFDATTGTASGEITVALDRIGKADCGANVKINVTLTLKAVADMEVIADTFLDTYMCVTHSDVIFTNNFGSSIVKENYVPALIKAMNLDTNVYDFDITNFPFVNPGVGRAEGEASDDSNPMVCVITHKDTGITHQFEFGCVTLKYFNTDDEGGWAKHFNAPVQVLPEACHEDISSIQSPKDAEAIFAAMATEIAVENFTSEDIWNAINAATGIGTDIWELAIEKVDIDAIIAGVEDFQYTGEVTLRLERLGKPAVYGETTIELTLKHKVALDMQAAIDKFLDSTECVHGDYNFMFTYGGSMTPDTVTQVVSEAIGNPAKYYVTLDGNTADSGYDAMNNKYLLGDWLGGGGEVVKFILHDIATGTQIPFEFKMVGKKNFSFIDYVANGLEDFHNTDWDNAGGNNAEGYTDALGIGAGAVYAPWGCNDLYGTIDTNNYTDEILAQLDEYKDDNGTVVIEVADLANITAQVGTSYGNVWHAINDLLKYDHPEYYMVLTADAVHDLIVAGGEGTLKIKLTPSNGYKGLEKGDFREISFKFVQKDVETIVDDFLSDVLCGAHGQIEMAANNGSSWTQEAVLAAFVDGLGINTATHTLEITAWSENYVNGGYGRETSGGEDLSFKLTEIATGTSAEFDVHCYVTKFYAAGDVDDGWFQYTKYPVSITWGCPDDVSSLKSIPECNRILLGFLTKTDSEGYLNISYSVPEDGWYLEEIYNEIMAMLPVYNARHHEVEFNWQDMDAAIANGGTGVVQFKVHNTVKGEAHKAIVEIPVKLTVK